MSVENEQARAGRDGRTCLTRPNTQARTGTGENHSLCSADDEKVWQPNPVDAQSASYDDNIYISNMSTTYQQ